MTKGATCCVISVLWSFIGSSQIAFAFTVSQPRQTRASFRQSVLHSSSSPDTHPSPRKKEGSTLQGNEQASKWRAEAERMRLEAEKMDVSLTLNKIESIERKLGKKVWLEKNPAEQADLEKKLEALQRKLAGDDTVIMLPKTDIPLPVPVETAFGVTGSEAVKSSSSTVSTAALSEVRSAEKVKHDKSSDPSDNPLSGFDEEDLALYLPAAEDIEARMTNATLSEKLEAFQTAPELQEHMKKKIQTMLVQPMEDMQRLEDMKQKYLYSSSSVEKEKVKKEIDRLEKTLEDDGPFSYSDSIYKGLPTLTEEETVARLEAVGALPQVLQSLYKARAGLGPDGDLRLAIELDHYESQVQLLEQIRFVTPLDKDSRAEAVTALNSLPSSVRDHLAKGLGLNDGNDNGATIRELSAGGDNPAWNSLQNVVGAAATTPDLPEYDDIEFVDRSRYMEEFYPSIARLEGQHPSMKDVDQFIAEIVDRKTFMVNRKPERVVGGYYIRGDNLISDDEDGVQMVERLQEKLDLSPLGQKLIFFFIPDPSPYTDEEIESGIGHEPVLVLTTKNPEVLYDCARPLTKGLISALGISSILIFSLAICELQPSIQEHIESAVAAGETDVSWLTDIAALIAVSSLSIQIAHEAAHRLIAYKDKFDIGLPTPIPSIQLGIVGAITPFKSPPPSLRSMFDFSIVGPLVGLTASLAFLVTGLSMTASMDMDAAAQLPAMPIFLLQSSALGSGLVEYFLGTGVLVSGVAQNTVLPLHPFAISGFTGMLTNALALLPLGHTDGGRISLAMFGRKGTYLVNTFTTLLICGVGIFGLDQSRILLVYVLFTLVWQRELESPARNEVEELDFARGALGIAASLLVALVLVPML